MGPESSLLTRSGRTYWVRANLPSDLAVDITPASPKKSGKRFLEPFRLGDAQRGSLVAALAHRGIGDEESRNLYIAAMEYDLAGCRQLLEGAPRTPASPEANPDAAPATDPALLKLAEAAKALADSLSALDAAQRVLLARELENTDCFARLYGEAYIDALRLELNRLGTAIQAKKGALEVAKPAPVTREIRDFLRRAADAFGDCFETNPSTQPDSPFLHALRALSEVTGLALPLDEPSLTDILRPGR
jgi:hypothetical protein